MISNNFLEQLLLCTSSEERALLLQANHEGLEIELLETWKILADTQAKAGNRKRAVEIATQIHEVGAWGKNEKILALGQWTFGNVYMFLGELKLATAHYKAAETIYQQVNDPLNLARMSVGEIALLIRQGEYEDARRLAEKSWPVLEKSPHPADGMRLAGLFNNLGIIHDWLGRYEEALAYYQRKINYYEQAPQERKAQIEIARTKINRGLVKKRLNLWAEARADLLAGQQSLAERSGEDVPKSDQVRASIQIAEILARQGAAPEEVAQAFEKARAERAALPTAPNSLPDLLFLEVLFAQWQLSAGVETPEIKTHLQALLAEARTVDTGPEALQIQLLLAEYANRQGESAKAMTEYEQVKQAALKNKNWEMIYRAWMGQGHVLWQTHQIPASHKAFEEAIHVIENVGNKLTSDDFLSGFLDDKQDAYQALVFSSLEQKEWEQAFYWVERARARRLAEAFAKDKVAQKLIWEDYALTNLREICATLPKDTLMLAYALVQGTLWVFPLTTEGLARPQALGNAPNPHAVAQALTWLNHLANFPPSFIRRRTKQLIDSANQPLQTWFVNFVEPFSALLARYPKLIIIPDGPLHRLPFHALYDAKNGRYLLETHELSYASSAQTWMLAYQCQAQGQGGIAFEYGGDHLKHTKEEIRQIKLSHPDLMIYEGQEATFTQVQSEAVSTAEFLHFAAHAVFRADSPLFSYIDLADGRLEAQEVVKMNLNARFVCLSACDTGRGMLRGGEFLGLARAFLMAGARAVLVALWEVDDATAVQVMDLLYQQLHLGTSPATALCLAQRALLQAPEAYLHHPYYWAPFILLGAT
jgi:CHAT domain-containing protein